MRSTNTRIAVAAIVTALSAPALAGETEHPFPPLDHPSPAVVLDARGDEAAALRADPTWPGADDVAPAARLVATVADAPVFDAADRPTPDVLDASAQRVRHAVELGAVQARRVADKR